MAEFFTERNIKATRKDHRCEGCGTSIGAGEPAWYFSQKHDGDFFAAHYHPECRAAEIALNNLRGTYDGEWDSLYEIADEREDVEWLVEKHPIVAVRMGFKPRVEA